MSKILVIDDQKSIRNTLKDVLEYESHEVSLAENGPQGLELFESEKHEVVLCDIKMPDMDGIEVLNRIHLINPDVPVIMISGHGNIDTAVDAIKKVSLPSLILICGVGTLINLTCDLKGFELMSNALASIMSISTVYPLLSLTSSAMSLFTISRLVVITLVPTIPGIMTAIPGVSVQLAITAVAAGAFASSIGPMSGHGALIMQNLGQQ